MEGGYGPRLSMREWASDDARSGCAWGTEAKHMDEEQDPDDCEDGEADGDESGGHFATLRQDGPRESLGSIGHPEECTPCTFYCFAKRGCKRGVECKFCHLWHQSKLQQRREAWKQQQRLKRKALAERSTAEVVREGPAVPKGKPSDTRRVAASSARPIALFGLLGGEGTNKVQDRLLTCQTPPQPAFCECSSSASSPDSGGAIARTRGLGFLATSPVVFADDRGAKVFPPTAPPTSPPQLGPAFEYSPKHAVLAIGQIAEFWPRISATVLRFRSTAPLPSWLVLDGGTGQLQASPQEAVSSTHIAIEADVLGACPVRATIELEVIDFSRGGFTIGHLSEVEPGKFMALLHVPEEGYVTDDLLPPPMPAGPPTSNMPWAAPEAFGQSAPPGPPHNFAGGCGACFAEGGFQGFGAVAAASPPSSAAGALASRAADFELQPPWLFKGSEHGLAVPRGECTPVQHEELEAPAEPPAWVTTTPGELSDGSEVGDRAKDHAFLQLTEALCFAEASGRFGDGDEAKVLRSPSRQTNCTDLPSVGSAAHFAGACNPCAFVHKGGCQSGTSCQFCHLCGPGEKRRKKDRRGFQRTMMPEW